MHFRKTFLAALYWTFLLLSGNAALAQVLTASLSAESAVCQTATATISLYNDQAEALTGLELAVQLPPCAPYLPGSLSGGQELDISDTTAPIFELPDLPPDSTLVLTFQQKPSCACIDQINAGEQFSNQFSLSYDGGELLLPGDPFAIETGLLVVTNVVNGIFTGSKGQTFNRSFTIRNTRFGPIERFTFEDAHQGGLVLSAAPGNVLPSAPNSLLLELDGAHFSAVGDGDEFFEFNESITITEEVLIVDCGFDQFSSASTVRASWGCDSDQCQQAVQTAVVKFLPSTLHPVMLVEPLSETPVCFCGPDGAQHGLVIKNEGTEAATDLTFTIRQIREGTGIDPLSFFIDSAGVLQSVMPVPSEPFEPEALCDVPDELYRSAMISIPVIEAGDSLVLYWDVFYCSLLCNQSDNRWGFKYTYYKSCPPIPFISIDEFIVNASGPEFLGVLDGPIQLLDGEVHPFEYQLLYDSLTSLTGELTLQLYIPCGLSWQNDPMELGGALPSSLDLLPGDSFLLVQAIYDLPLPANVNQLFFDLGFSCDELCQEPFICRDSLITSCPDNGNCGATPPSLLPIEVITSLSDCSPGGAPCSLQSCSTLSPSHECQPDSVCLQVIEGYALAETTFRRINLGLADADDDRIPDGIGIADPALARTDRAIAGDTVETVISSVVVADVPGATFQLATVDLEFLPIGLDPGTNGQLLDPNAGIPLIEARLRIVDQNTGNEYLCDGFSVATESDDIRLKYVFDLSVDELAAGGCLPDDFVYEAGDSLIFTSRHRIAYNLKKENATASYPPIRTVVTRPDLRIFNVWPEPGEESPFLCGCSQISWELSGYEYIAFPGFFAGLPCDTSDYKGASFFSISLGEGNFFPFEIRSLGLLDHLTIDLPSSVELVQARINRFSLQEGIDLKVNEPIAGIPDGDSWTFDFLPCQVVPVDEGFAALLQYRFLLDCPIGNNYTTSVSGDFLWDPSLPEEDPVAHFSETGSYFFPLTPTLQLSAPEPFDISLDNKARWDFTLKNAVTIVASQQSQEAPHCWLQAQSPSGLLTDLILLDTGTGDPVPEVNGIFQLGQLDTNEVRSYQLIALNLSCQEEDLDLTFGWNCTPYLDAEDTPCVIWEQAFKALSPNGELELQVEGPLGDCPQLCDTVPYHQITIFNADLGPVCELHLDAILPTGFSVLPGTSQLAYPSDDSFVDISDPLDLGNGTVRWPLYQENALLAADCLPGVTAGPLHELRLRFLGTTDCSFTVGSKLTFQATGQQNCALPTNIITRQGMPVCIQTFDEADETFINVNLESPVGCQDTVTLSFGIVHTDQSGAGDSIRVKLPVDLQYVFGSFTGLLNPPAGEPLIANVNGQEELRWGFPPGVPAWSPISFQVQVEGFAEKPCGTEYLTAQATAETQAICALTGDTCSVHLESGSTLEALPIERPILQIPTFTLEIWPAFGGGDSIAYSIEVENLGANLSQSVEIDLYLDLDGDLQWSADDQLVGSHSLTDLLLPANGVFLLPPQQLCRVYAYIDPDKHCACSTDLRFPTAPIIYHTGQEPVLCSGEELVLGACLPGANTNWAPAEGLSCDTCCQTLFQWINSGLEPAVFDLTQEMTFADGCQVNYQYGLTVRPQPGILYADPEICLGGQANLVATSGVSYHWQGPGITDPSLPVQQVSPIATASFSVTVVDTVGCLGVDTTLVSVLPLPLADAGGDTVFCPGDLLQLHAIFQADYDYLWMPFGNLSDPNVADPELLAPIPGAYTLTVTDPFNCQDVDTIQVTFGAPPNLSIAGDDMICLGNSTLLTASGAVAYAWSPAAAVECLDPPLCDSVSVAPPGTTIYSVTGISDSGCPAELSLTIMVIDSNMITIDTIETCAGTPVSVHDLLTDVAGFYCDTTVLANECLFIDCIDLRVSDTTYTPIEETICAGDTLWFGERFYLDPGVYFDTLTDLAGCDSVFRIELQNFPIPGIVVDPPNANILLGESVALSVEGEGVSFFWEPGSSLSCQECPTPLATPEESTEYLLTVVDEYGCSRTLSVPVTVSVICDVSLVEIPNAFTPDGDGVNDAFGLLVGENLVEVRSLEIWNRWGEAVYSGAGPTAQWDGTQDGEQANMDVYLYRIQFYCPIDGAEQTRTGEVQLIR